MTGFCFGRSLGFRVSALGFLSSILIFFFPTTFSIFILVLQFGYYFLPCKSRNPFVTTEYVVTYKRARKARLEKVCNIFQVKGAFNVFSFFHLPLLLSFSVFSPNITSINHYPFAMISCPWYVCENRGDSIEFLPGKFLG